MLASQLGSASSTSAGSNRFANVTLNTGQSHQPTGSVGVASGQGPYTMFSNSTQQQPISQTQSQLLPQTELQQSQQQQQLYDSQQQQLLPNQQKSLEQQKQPDWFNNPKKRTLPQTLVRRPSRKQSSTSSVDRVAASSSSSSSGVTGGSRSLTAGPGFSTVTFGLRKPSGNSLGDVDLKNQKYLSNDHHASSILGDTNEAPPTASLLDWEKEVITSRNTALSSQQPLWSSSTVPTTSLTSVNSNVPSTIRSNNGAPNVFDKGYSAESLNKRTQNGISRTESAEHMHMNEGKRVENIPLYNEESAVIVFGYPESISNAIITHFAKFGNILEDFEVLRGSSGINTATLRKYARKAKNTDLSATPQQTIERKYPIYTGDGWVKLTFDSSSSAVRAIQENGKVFGGSLVGCIPYSKAAVEQLASCKIDKIDDIGNFHATVPVVTREVNENDGSMLFNGNENANMLSTPVSSRPLDNPLASSIESTLPRTSAQLAYSSHRLNIKDGKTLFLHNTNNKNQNFLQNIEYRMRQQEQHNLEMKQQNKAGLLNKVNNWLFGWNDI